MGISKFTNLYRGNKIMLCCGYWESPHTLDEPACCLVHEEWPEKADL